ncbi:MAG: hypothetical protein H6Q33_3678 [Deltaproteobacteria bacterium]|nr:hypothetical protein [Deltaproteobacteria bacterium]
MGWNPCIISVATRHKRYPEALVRLRESVLRSGFTGEFLCWPPGVLPDGCPPHLDTPFAFKPYGFHEACRRGKDLVLWLDASCVVVRKLDRLFQTIADEGHVLFRNGDFALGEWASDQALGHFEVSREHAMSMHEVNAAALGLNMKNQTAVDFLEQWYRAAKQGLPFRGVRDALGTWEDYAAIKWNRGNKVSADPRVRGHRHDQTVAGLLAHKLGMKLTTHGLQTYSHQRSRIGFRTVIVIDRDAQRGYATLTRLERLRRDRYLGGFVPLLRRPRQELG